ncbi:MAG TPA: hypothetical protein VKQ27_19030 [Acetobacteraceae bacterium]|nr:hypothetical protein [Acetobacteraceae bacterium]
MSTLLHEMRMEPIDQPLVPDIAGVELTDCRQLFVGFHPVGCSADCLDTMDLDRPLHATDSRLLLDADFVKIGTGSTDNWRAADQRLFVRLQASDDVCRELPKPPQDRQAVGPDATPKLFPPLFERRCRWPRLDPCGTSCKGLDPLKLREDPVLEFGSLVSQRRHLDLRTRKVIRPGFERSIDLDEMAPCRGAPRLNRSPVRDLRTTGFTCVDHRHDARCGGCHHLSPRPGDPVEKADLLEGPFIIAEIVDDALIALD